MYVLQTAAWLACVLYKTTICLLLLAAVGNSGVQPEQIYADEGNGTVDPSCWENGPESPCMSVAVALDSAEQLTTVVVKQKVYLELMRLKVHLA